MSPRGIKKPRFHQSCRTGIPWFPWNVAYLRSDPWKCTTHCIRSPGGLLQALPLGFLTSTGMARGFPFAATPFGPSSEEASVSRTSKWRLSFLHTLVGCEDRRLPRAPDPGPKWLRRRESWSRRWSQEQCFGKPPTRRAQPHTIK